MSVRKNIFKIIIAVVLVATIFAVGYFSYQSGVAHGIAQNIDIEALQEGSLPYMKGMNPYAMQPGLVGFHSGGFIFLRLIGGLFFFFIIIGLIRMLFFRRAYAHWGMRGHALRYCRDGQFDGNVPPFVKDMHNKMHEDLDKDNQQDNPSDDQASAA